jgi:hypothetical protein
LLLELIEIAHRYAEEDPMPDSEDESTMRSGGTVFMM